MVGYLDNNPKKSVWQQCSGAFLCQLVCMHKYICPNAQKTYKKSIKNDSGVYQTLSGRRINHAKVDYPSKPVSLVAIARLRHEV